MANANMGRRIIGGSELGGNTLDWMGILLEKSRFFCGATLIHPNWGLTAAHCMEGKIGSRHLYVEFKRYDREASYRNEVGAVRRQISYSVIHPDYQEQNRFINDYALIYFNEPVNDLQTINLDFQFPQSYQNQQLFVSGWGYVTNIGPTSRFLKVGSIDYLSFQACNQRWGSLNPDSHTCAIGGAGTCSGDSGGPLFYTNNENIYQVGVTSFGNECGHPFYPGVYSQISGMNVWYNQVLSQGIPSLSVSSKASQLSWSPFMLILSVIIIALSILRYSQ